MAIYKLSELQKYCSRAMAQYPGLTELCKSDYKYVCTCYQTVYTVDNVGNNVKTDSEFDVDLRILCGDVHFALGSLERGDGEYEISTQQTPWGELPCKIVCNQPYHNHKSIRRYKYRPKRVTIQTLNAKCDLLNKRIRVESGDKGSCKVINTPQGYVAMLITSESYGTGFGISFPDTAKGCITFLDDITKAYIDSNSHAGITGVKGVFNNIYRDVSRRYPALKVFVNTDMGKSIGTTTVMYCKKQGSKWAHQECKTNFTVFAYMIHLYRAMKANKWGCSARVTQTQTEYGVFPTTVEILDEDKQTKTKVVFNFS